MSKDVTLSTQQLLQVQTELLVKTSASLDAFVSLFLSMSTEHNEKLFKELSGAYSEATKTFISKIWQDVRLMNSNIIINDALGKDPDQL